MLVLKIPDFAKWAKRQKIADWQLLEVVQEMNKGLIGDRLGSYVFKKRMPLSGRGKRGGARSILCYKKDEVALFLYGYAKNVTDNLCDDEIKALREYSKEFMEFTEEELLKRISDGLLIKVSESN